MISRDEYEQLKGLDILTISRVLNRIVSESHHVDEWSKRYDPYVAAAYTALLVQKHPDAAGGSLKELIAASGISELAAEALCSLAQPDELEVARQLAADLSEAQLQAAVLWDVFRAQRSGTVGKLIGAYSLIPALLQVEPGRTLGCFGENDGTFFVNVYPQIKGAQVTEFVTGEVPVAVLRASLLAGGDTPVRWQSEEDLPEQAFQCVFAQPDDKDFREVEDLLEVGLHDAEILAGMPGRVRWEWYPTAAALQLMESNGRAVVLTTPSALGHQRARNARRQLVDSGRLEAVISLQGGLLGIWSIALVLSHDNESVRFVDAIDLGAGTRTRAWLGADEIRTILERTQSDSGMSRSMPRAELTDEAVSLLPGVYVHRTGLGQAAVRLGDVALRITRGLHVSKHATDKSITEEPSECKCINTGDMQDGVVRSEDLTSYYHGDMDDPGLKMVTDGAVVVTRIARNGLNTAIAEIPEDESVTALGNVYVMDLDRKRMDPYYLQAYFASDTGRRALRSMSVGSSTLMLPLNELKELQVPVPPLEEQEEIGRRYREVSHKRLQIRDEMAALETELQQIWKPDDV